jgi:hypothetical protein
MAGRGVRCKGREKTGVPVRRTSRERGAMAAGVTDRRRMRPSASKICTNHRRRVSLGAPKGEVVRAEYCWRKLGHLRANLRDTFPGWSTSQDTVILWSDDFASLGPILPF